MLSSLESLVVDDAAGAEPVALLKPPDRGLNERIEHRTGAGDRIEIAGDHQPLPQRLHHPGLGADAQLGGGGHHIPAAARDDPLVLLDRRLGRRKRRRRQNRRRFPIDCQAVGGLVALPPFGLRRPRAVALLSQSGRTRQDRSHESQGADGRQAIKRAPIGGRRVKLVHGQASPQVAVSFTISRIARAPKFMSARPPWRRRAECAVVAPHKEPISRAILWLEPAASGQC